MKENIFSTDLKNFSKKLSGVNTRSGINDPYIFYDNENNKKLLFNVKVNNSWKLHIYDFNTRKIEQVSTITSDIENIDECNPTIYINNKNNYILSYVAVLNTTRV